MRQRPSLRTGLFLTAICQLVLLSGCAGVRWDKAGADEAATARDEQECRAKARAAVQRSGSLAIPPVSDPRFGPPAGGTQSERLMQAEEDVGACMKEKGYQLVPDGK